MNNKRRSKLNTAYEQISSAASILSIVRDEEEDCLNNMPENLENSEKYNKMENAVDLLTDVVDSIDDIMDSIKEAME